MLEDGFVEFFETEVPTNPMKAEYLLPTIIGGMLREGLRNLRRYDIIVPEVRECQGQEYMKMSIKR